MISSLIFFNIATLLRINKLLLIIEKLQIRFILCARKICKDSVWNKPLSQMYLLICGSLFTCCSS